MGDNGENGGLSTLYHALRARRRRRVIQIVKDSEDSTCSVRTLARQIAAAEHELPIKNATGEPYRNAYNALSQTHLPTLAEAGIVIYDPKRQTVSRGQRLPLATLLIAINDSAVATIDEIAFQPPTEFH